LLIPAMLAPPDIAAEEEWKKLRAASKGVADSE
jgi:hypothetical protein